jgi:hypothetical protein
MQFGGIMQARVFISVDTNRKLIERVRLAEGVPANGPVSVHGKALNLARRRELCNAWDDLKDNKDRVSELRELARAEKPNKGIDLELDPDCIAIVRNAVRDFPELTDEETALRVAILAATS